MLSYSVLPDKEAVASPYRLLTEVAKIAPTVVQRIAPRHRGNGGRMLDSAADAGPCGDARRRSRSMLTGLGDNLVVPRVD